MRVVSPIKVIPSNYSYSGVDTSTDTPTPDWSFGGTYVALDQVYYQGFIYAARVSIAASSGQSPDLDVLRWEKVGVKSFHAPFDTQSSTSVKQFSVGQSIQYYVNFPAPGGVGVGFPKVDTVALFSVENFTRAKLTVNIGMDLGVYEQEISLSRVDVTDWYDYFFAEDEQIDHALFDNIPVSLSQSPEFIIDLYDDRTDLGPLEEQPLASVGTIIFGKTTVIGETQVRPSLGIVDYSRKETDDFGQTSFVKRAFSKRANFSVFINNDSLTRVFNILSSLRATPCVWIPTSIEKYQSLNLYGYYKDFNIDIQYLNHSLVSIEVEGLT